MVSYWTNTPFKNYLLQLLPKAMVHSHTDHQYYLMQNLDSSNIYKILIDISRFAPKSFQEKNGFLKIADRL